MSSALIEKLEDIYPRYSQELLSVLANDYQSSLTEYLTRTDRGNYHLGEMFQHERTTFKIESTDVVVSGTLFFKAASFAKRDIHPKRDDSGQILPSEIYKVPHPIFVGSNREPKSFFDSYVKPLLDAKWPGCKVVIFLAADLLCLQGILQDRGFHVIIMKHSSIAHNPGALWRYLAFNFPCKYVYFADTDNLVQERRLTRLSDVLDLHPEIALVRPLQHTGNCGHMALILGNDFMIRPSLVNFNAAKSMLGYIALNLLTEDRPSSFVHENRHGRPYFNPRVTDTGYRGPTPAEKVPRRCFPYYGFDEQWLKETVYYHFSKDGRMATLVQNRREDDRLQTLDLFHQQSNGNLVIWPTPKG